MANPSPASASPTLADRAAITLAERTPGLQWVRRPASAGSPPFDLAYVRTGPRTHTPIVVIPGGPGLASILPYRDFRRWATARDLDIIMVEHRGVGLSRADLDSRPLPFSAMWSSEVTHDIAAVLDREGVSQAVIAGSSYGSYLAASFGVTHPGRVAGTLMDSTLLSSRNIIVEREMVRATLWNAQNEVSEGIRRLALNVPQPELLDVTRAAYELGGPELLLSLVRSRLHYRFHPAWSALAKYSMRGTSLTRIPCVYDFALAGAIGFRELDYAPPPDGLPFDPALTYAAIAERFPPFEGTPLDLATQVSRFPWPTVFLAGSRDLRTPPIVARRLAEGSMNAMLVDITNGHSALDTDPLVFLTCLQYLVGGRQRELPDLTDRLKALPRLGSAERFAGALRALLRLQ